MTPDTSTREFVAVPREATDEMLAAAEAASFGWPRDFARHYKAMIEAAPLSTVPAAPVDEDEGEFVSCENCDDKRVPLADAVYSESCHFCPKCYEAWKDEFDTCEHSLVPHTDEYGDECELCTKCSGIVRYPDETPAPEPAAPVAGEDARPRIYELKKKALELGQGDYDTWPAEQRLGFDCGIAVAEWPMPPVIDDAAVEREVREAWQNLMDKDDRNSPADYPDHCLITRKELGGYMRAALHAAFPTGEG